jgi:hypothetical protein
VRFILRWTERLIVASLGTTTAEHVHTTIKGINLLNLGLLLLLGGRGSARGSGGGGTTGRGTCSKMMRQYGYEQLQNQHDNKHIVPPAEGAAKNLSTPPAFSMNEAYRVG